MSEKPDKVYLHTNFALRSKFVAEHGGTGHIVRSHKTGAFVMTLDYLLIPKKEWDSKLCYAFIETIDALTSDWYCEQLFTIPT